MERSGTEKMTIGIIGLGLIGGSLAKSIKSKTPHRVFALDINDKTMATAEDCGTFDEKLTSENISECNLIFLAVSPAEAVKWIKNHAEKISSGTIVIDLCGVKRYVCDEISKIAREHGFVFVGGHPMAGLERGGFENSKADLFDGASMILTPDENMKTEILEKLKNFFLEAGFGSVTLSTPEEHDRIIAYTSQLPHIISSAYIKSPEALKRRGFSAGSFRDMSRVSSMDEKLWTELFLYNRDFLTGQLETVMKNLNEYLDALKENDSEKLEKLIKDGREMKTQAMQGSKS